MKKKLGKMVELIILHDKIILIMLISLILLVVISILAAYFYRQKLNKSQAMGGAISLPKLYWLLLAINIYYTLPLIFWFSLPKSEAAFFILIGFLLFMVLRMVVQLYLMYIKKAWIPPYGISFNIMGAVLILVLNIYFWQIIGTDNNFLIKGWSLLAAFCQILDSYYAWAFYKMVGQQTTSKKPIWFANSEAKRFKRINKITLVFNVLISAGLFAVIVGYFVL